MGDEFAISLIQGEVEYPEMDREGAKMKEKQEPQ